MNALRELHYAYDKLFRWDKVRCAQIRAELDAYYARLHGRTSASSTR
jgi:hypothetical protein